MLAIFVDEEEVAAVGSKGGFDGRLDGDAGADVGEDLTSSLGLVGALTISVCVLGMWVRWFEVPSLRTMIVGV